MELLGYNNINTSKTSVYNTLCLPSAGENLGYSTYSPLFSALDPSLRVRLA